MTKQGIVFYLDESILIRLMLRESYEKEKRLIGFLYDTKERFFNDWIDYTGDIGDRGRFFVLMVQ